MGVVIRKKPDIDVAGDSMHVSIKREPLIYTHDIQRYD